MNIIRIFLLVFSLNLNAQVHTVMNHQLQIQLAKNQTARLASNETFFKSWEKQKALYDTINARMVTVVAIQDKIYRNLNQVHSSVWNLKKLNSLRRDMAQIPVYLNELRKEATKNPKYAVLYTDSFENVIYQTIDIKKELEDEILAEGRDYLKDAYDRNILIDKVYSKVNGILGGLGVIINNLKYGNKKNYLEKIPILGEYVFQDKLIVNEIMNDINRLIKY